MYERKIAEDLDCGIVIAMKVFGAKWKPCIIDALSRGLSRPSELHRDIYTATPRVLDMQLSELESMGVVRKTSATGFPLRSEYQLTEIGLSILPIIGMMNRWGNRHGELIRHRLQVIN